MRNLFSKALLVTSAAVGALYAGALRAEDAKLVQTNLVSDIMGLAAVTDTNLKNPWGVRTAPQAPSGSRTRDEHGHSLQGHRRDGRL
jgi:hypothetical protein